jgi:hypothetical protein
LPANNFLSIGAEARDLTQVHDLISGRLPLS